MYKVKIEKTAGQVTVVTTVETDDVELVKKLLEIENVTHVDSDATNLNVNREWQDILQRIEKLERERAFADLYKQVPKPYQHPFNTGTPFGPLTNITC